MGEERSEGAGRGGKGQEGPEGREGGGGGSRRRPEGTNRKQAWRTRDSPRESLEKKEKRKKKFFLFCLFLASPYHNVRYLQWKCNHLIMTINF